MSLLILPPYPSMIFSHLMSRFSDLWKRNSQPWACLPWWGSIRIRMASCMKWLTLLGVVSKRPSNTLKQFYYFGTTKAPPTGGGRPRLCRWLMYDIWYIRIHLCLQTRNFNIFFKSINTDYKWISKALLLLLYTLGVVRYISCVFVFSPPFFFFGLRKVMVTLVGRR
jgi:hypothetical protein